MCELAAEIIGMGSLAPDRGQDMKLTIYADSTAASEEKRFKETKTHKKCIAMDPRKGRVRTSVNQGSERHFKSSRHDDQIRQ